MEQITRDWQLEVSTNLGTIAQKIEGLTTQVEKQNGNVARLWEHVTELERQPKGYGLQDRVQALEIALIAAKAGTEAADAATSTWKRWAERLAFAAIGIFFILILLNAKAILPSFSH